MRRITDVNTIPPRFSHGLVALFALGTFATLILVGHGLAFAGVPSLLNFQSVLHDAVGDIAPDGNYSVTFRIWDAENSGTVLWQEGRLIAVQGGLFTVLLGSIVPIPDTLFSNPDRWIGLQVGLDAEMTPRQRLVTVPFAWESYHAVLSDTAAHSLDKTTDASELSSGSLDTARFSAYQDLLVEGRIGTAPDEVAAGDHTHAMGNLRTREDTTFVSAVIPAGGVEYVLKEILIPAGEVGHFLHIMARVETGDATCQNSIAKFNFTLNGAVAYEWTPQLGPSPTGILETRLWRQGDPGDARNWYAYGIGGSINPFKPIIDFDSDVLLRLTATVTSGGNCGGVKVHGMIVMFEGH